MYSLENPLELYGFPECQIFCNWPQACCPWCYGLVQHEYLALSVPVQTDKDLNLQVAGDPCLAVWLWDKHWIPIWRDKLMSFVNNAFAVSLGIAGMTVSNQTLLHETESRPITSIVHQHELWLYGHVARNPEADPACQVVWGITRGGGSQGGNKVNVSCWELLGMGRVLAWGLALGDHWSWRRRVGKAPRPSVYAPNNWLIDSMDVHVKDCI